MLLIGISFLFLFFLIIAIILPVLVPWKETANNSIAVLVLLTKILP